MTTPTPSPDHDSPVVACTLAGGMQGRITEWQTVLSHVVDRAPIPNGLRLTFGENPSLTELSRLAAAEVECCSFFRINLGFDRRGVILEVTAPEEAQPLLDSLFGPAV